MNIALCHYRVGETDGVSLEMDKWKCVLERMGHKVYLLAGSMGASEGYIIPELLYKNETNQKIFENAFQKLADYENKDGLRRAITDYATRIEGQLEKFVKEYKIDVLVPNNIWSSGWSLSAGLAFYSVAKKMDIRCVAHHHDFYWERDKYNKPTCAMVQELLDNYFPPKDDQINHVVINNIAKNELFKRKRIEASVVPNVFKIKTDSWAVDNYNKDFRKAIDIKDNDILVLQATRITERKAIELAIDVVAQMQAKRGINALTKGMLYNGRKFDKNSRVVLVLAGMSEGSSRYVDLLKKRAQTNKVSMVFINDIIEHSRREVNGKKIYSLWDAYAHADIVTYPSIWEGWGNQFLEAVFTMKPMVIYEYPVYKSDIKYKGFNVVSLGDAHEVSKKGLAVVEKGVIKNAAKQAIEMLVDTKKRNIAVDRNFEICNKFYSFESLQGMLEQLF